MTPPRCILPNATYLVTRRISERRFFLLPSEEVNEFLRFALARSAARCGILVHVYVFLSNHYHLVVTDPGCRIAEFVGHFHAAIARAMNRHRGRRGQFWEGGKPSYVRLVEPQDVLDKMIYALANPVSSWLVKTPSQWPGAASRPEEINGPPRVARHPEWSHFGSRSKAPQTAELKLVRPPRFDELGDVEFVALLRDGLDRRVRELGLQAEAAGTTFLGRARVLAQDPNDAPRTPEEPGRRNPQIACRDADKRIEALRALRSFYREYRAALGAFRKGESGVPFPFGTWLMRVRFKVHCASPPAA